MKKTAQNLVFLMILILLACSCASGKKCPAYTSADCSVTSDKG